MSKILKAGTDYIGVAVGAIVFNAAGEVFLSLRGPNATNERGTWEFPGGKVDFGERLKEAVKREFMEEYGFVIDVGQLLDVDDHILADEGQHWVSSTFLARYVDGEPRILEPDKCTAIGWFAMDNLPSPLSLITQYNVRSYREKILKRKSGQ
jgi:8-oxo-dGTP diphosphatase